MSDTTRVTGDLSGPNNDYPERTLPLKVCIGWGIGSLGMAVMFGLINTFALTFMVNYLAIASGLAGLLIGLSKIYDGLTDPIMGIITDRTQTKWGRRRPYLIVGAFLLAASMVTMFNVPDFGSQSAIVVYMILVLLLYATAYTVFNVPYLSMPAEMTDGYHERSYLMSFRVYGIAAAGYVGLAVGPMLIDGFGGGREGFEVMAWIMGGVVLLSSILCFHYTKDAPFKQRVDTSHFPIKEQVRLALENRPFLWLILSKLCGLLGGALSAPAKAFFFPLVLGASLTSFGYYWIAFYTAMIVSQPFWLRQGKAYGKRNVFIFGLLASVVINLTWLVATPAEPYVITIIRGVLLGLTGGCTLLMGQAMLPDTMEYDVRRTGIRREGIFAGFYTTIEKFSYALGPAITGLVLGSMGYIASRDGMVEQPDSAIFAIYVCAAGLPALLGILGALCLTRYDLTEEKLKATVRIVAARAE
ncbi:MAG: MFS transporter [Rhodospirillaceae bacterium]